MFTVLLVLQLRPVKVVRVRPASGKRYLLSSM
jgi:hypothetical protein